MLSNNKFVWGDIKLYLLLGIEYNEINNAITGGDVGINNYEYKKIFVSNSKSIHKSYSVINTLGS